MRWSDPDPTDDFADRRHFCPRCREITRDGSPLCAFCGESLVAQGYCRICETYWSLPEGAECPKHEVALESHPPQPEDWGRPGVAPALATLGKFARPGQAEAIRIRLEAEGIPTFLQGERMGSGSMYQVATGGVTLQVPEPLAADARILLSQTWSSPQLADDLDDAWEELAPAPGESRRAIMKGLILVMLFGPPVMGLIFYLLGH
jgi:hypothetical protein